VNFEYEGLQRGQPFGPGIGLGVYTGAVYTVQCLD